jgi:hypothetical protein
LSTVLQVELSIFGIEIYGLAVRVVIPKRGYDFTAGWGPATVLNDNAEHGVAFAAGTLHANN